MKDIAGKLGDYQCFCSYRCRIAGETPAISAKDCVSITLEEKVADVGDNQILAGSRDFSINDEVFHLDVVY